MEEANYPHGLEPVVVGSHLFNKHIDLVDVTEDCLSLAHSNICELGEVPNFVVDVWVCQSLVHH